MARLSSIYIYWNKENSTYIHVINTILYILIGISNLCSRML